MLFVPRHRPGGQRHDIRIAGFHLKPHLATFFVAKGKEFLVFIDGRTGGFFQRRSQREVQITVAVVPNAADDPNERRHAPRKLIPDLFRITYPLPARRERA